MSLLCHCHLDYKAFSFKLFFQVVLVNDFDLENFAFWVSFSPEAKNLSSFFPTGQFMAIFPNSKIFFWHIATAGSPKMHKIDFAQADRAQAQT